MSQLKDLQIAQLLQILDSLVEVLPTLSNVTMYRLVTEVAPHVEKALLSASSVQNDNLTRARILTDGLSKTGLLLTTTLFYEESFHKAIQQRNFHSRRTRLSLNEIESSLNLNTQHTNYITYSDDFPYDSAANDANPIPWHIKALVRTLLLVIREPQNLDIPLASLRRIISEVIDANAETFEQRNLDETNN